MKLITIKRSVDRGDLEEHPKLCISHLGKLHKNADPWAQGLCLSGPGLRASICPGFRVPGGLWKRLGYSSLPLYLHFRAAKAPTCIGSRGHLAR